jgi:hypothetical protein
LRSRHPAGRFLHTLLYVLKGQARTHRDPGLRLQIKRQQSPVVATGLPSRMATLAKPRVTPELTKVVLGSIELAHGIAHDRSTHPPPILLTSAPGPYPPGRQSYQRYQPKAVGPAFVGVIRIKQRRCLIMAVR